MRTRTLLALTTTTLSLAGTLTVLPVSGAAAAPKQAAVSPLVFGHRGASGYRPEHTLASYALAIAQGADVIEPDVVSTRDGVLVARHENEISGTTDVETKFPDRKRTKTIDDVVLTGWFTEDLTLAELKTLRAEERLPEVRQENTVFNGRYQVPTLDEVLALAKRASKTERRTIGVAPETKHPSYFDSIGLSMEEKLLQDLREAGLDKAKSPVYIQSFEVDNLRDLRRLGAKVDLVQLVFPTGGPQDSVDKQERGQQVRPTEVSYAAMTTPAGLREIATYADVLGPEKSQVISNTTDRVPTSLVGDAHAAGLQVVPYTVRAENRFLPLVHRRGTDPNAYGNVFGELAELYRAGVDGIFVDQPDIAVAARDER